MFTQKCFIRKYNKELIGKLQNLGYKLYGCYERSNATAIISTKNYDWQTQIAFGSMVILGIRLEAIGKGSIDCGTNEEMFLALAALRDDSDKFQLFVKEDFYEGKRFTRWYLCHSDKISDELISFKEYHKATPKEIVEHFTRKEK